MINKKLIRPRIMSDAFSRNMATPICRRCGRKAEIETERGFLCNECDCERLSCINNTENPKSEKQFWKEIK